MSKTLREESSNTYSYKILKDLFFASSSNKFQYHPTDSQGNVVITTSGSIPNDGSYNVSTGINVKISALGDVTLNYNENTVGSAKNTITLADTGSAQIITIYGFTSETANATTLTSSSNGEDSVAGAAVLYIAVGLLGVPAYPALIIIPLLLAGNSANEPAVAIIAPDKEHVNQTIILMNVSKDAISEKNFNFNDASSEYALDLSLMLGITLGAVYMLF